MKKLNVIKRLLIFLIISLIIHPASTIYGTYLLSKSFNGGKRTTLRLSVGLESVDAYNDIKSFEVICLYFLIFFQK